LRAGDILGRYSRTSSRSRDCNGGSARIAAERLMKAIRECRSAPPPASCRQRYRSADAGPSQASTVQQAANAALHALDAARMKRYDCFQAYEQSPARENARRRNITIADDVINALDENRMQLALQPIVSTKTREPALYECLLRMTRPDGTVVSAGDFIEVAEQLGLSRLIDRRTLELSIAFAGYATCACRSMSG
jgi:hypothetical protein